MIKQALFGAPSQSLIYCPVVLDSIAGLHTLSAWDIWCNVNYMEELDINL